MYVLSDDDEAETTFHKRIYCIITYIFFIIRWKNISCINTFIVSINEGLKSGIVGSQENIIY